jgi:hypothetical protein
MSLERHISVLTYSAAVVSIVAGFAGCGQEPSPTDQDQQALVGHRLEWKQVNVCATSIGVAPDDTIWVVGCDNRADGDIWYMRLADRRNSFDPGNQVWALTKGRAARVTVDAGGQAFAITSTGASLTADVQSKDANTVFKPSGNFQTLLHPDTCLMDTTMYHLDDFLVFVTGSNMTHVHDHHRFALHCPTDRGNGNFMHLFDKEPAWTDTGVLAQQIALFTPGSLFTPSAAKVPWIIDSSGVIKRYNENADGSGTFTTMPSPPTTAFGLTDHYALARDGIYEWIDAGGSWSRAIDNFTPTGSITQIAAAGAENRTPAGGQLTTFGPSHLWSIDTSGTIYAAIDTVVLR